MQKPTLVIMAAGMGSRFGGQKQMTPIDPEGHFIIDYSIYDAIRAGFDKVVCILKPEMEDVFDESIGKRISPFVQIAYAHQTLKMLPEGFSVPEDRVKPWGTAHAILCAKDAISAPFAAINADDFYGSSAIAAIHDFLVAPHGPSEHAMVGYRVENTLSKSGSVARGICKADEDGCLTEIIERTNIEARPDGAAFTEDGGKTYTFLPGDTLVSMNLWGFQLSILSEIENRFASFLRDTVPADPLKSEYFLPMVPNQLIQEKKAGVRVLPTDERWYGLTYREDMQDVVDAVATMKRDGVYPQHLWRK